MILPFNRQRLFKVLKWSAGDSGEEFANVVEADPMAHLEETEDLNAADIVTSEAKPLKPLFSDDVIPGKHMVMFDVDIPMSVVESSTPGHNHVYFNTYVSKDALFNLLDALVQCGVVEQGYANASKARGFTALRLPWVRKSERSRHV